MNKKNQISIAKQTALNMYEMGYTKPIKRTDIKVLGKQALGMMYVGADSMLAGHRRLQPPCNGQPSRWRSPRPRECCLLKSRPPDRRQPPLQRQRRRGLAQRRRRRPRRWRLRTPTSDRAYNYLESLDSPLVGG